MCVRGKGQESSKASSGSSNSPIRIMKISLRMLFVDGWMDVWTDRWMDICAKIFELLLCTEEKDQRIFLVFVRQNEKQVSK